MAIEELPVVRPTDVPEEVVDSAGNPAWGSDVILDLLRRLGIEYMTVMPGSTTRGIHDSAVNYTGNKSPELILCNHEMSTVSMARGYARATGKPMAALIHNVVGLLNTSMTIYDCWADRTPVLVLGGTGPVDSQRRRPRIDWLHTANLQGNAVRDFTKWDDQPASLGAVPESVLRGYRIAMTQPQGPVYLCFDTEIQEQELTEPFVLPDVARYRPANPIAPDPEGLRELASWLVEAELPMVFADRVGRDHGAVAALVELAELLAIPVVDMGNRMNFPTEHALNFTGGSKSLLREADLVLGLEAQDLFGQMRTPVDYTTRVSHQITNEKGQRVATISLDELIQGSWATDYQGLAAVDLPLLGDTAVGIPLLIEEVERLLDGDARERVERRRRALESKHAELRERRRQYVAERWDHAQISEARMLGELWNVIKDEDFAFTYAPPFERMGPGIVDLKTPEQFVAAGSGGGAVGAPPGVALGAALGLRGTGKLPVSIQGDGTSFGSIQSLWTAAHYEIAGLWVVNNNRSYYNDEHHQERISKSRGRPMQNSWIGQRCEDPEVDFAAIARTLDVYGEGPVKEAKDLEATYRGAVERVKAGEPAIVDVWTGPRAQL